jgi:predicted acetyltransferase
VLCLRPPGPDDERAFALAHAEMAEEAFPFGLGYAAGMPWGDYLAHLSRQRTGTDLPEGLVPATFLLAVVGDELVGRVSIRHELNAYLARQGGHIGYGVRPSARGMGLGTRILALTLPEAARLGIAQALLTCAKANLASNAVIRANGGVFQDEALLESRGEVVQRWWVPTGGAARPA